jgi:radical SAM protein with 4Fe4S-binding SPASM domain
MSSHLDQVRRRAFEKCIPLNVSFELTLRCNLRCVHCYNFDRDLSYLPHRKREEELSDEEVHRILDEVRAEGCLFLSLTGGEALLHPGLEEFIRHGRLSGMVVSLKSNGSLLDEAAVDRIVAAGASAVEISVYGSREETHDSFVKSPGAFRRTVDGARKARDAGLKVRFSFLILKRNADQIGAMIEMASQEKIPYTIDPQIFARYDGSRSSLDDRVDRETLDLLFRGPLRSLLPASNPARTSVQCSCARSVCGISAFGEVYPCIGAPIPSGNLRQHSFHEVWWSSPALQWIRGLRLDDFPACRSCEHMTHCRRSSGAIYNNTGMYNGPARFGDDWSCMEAEVFHRIHDEAS